MAMIDGLLEELEYEAQATRRILERVPQAHLGWKPHEEHPPTWSRWKSARWAAGATSMMASMVMSGRISNLDMRGILEASWVRASGSIRARCRSSHDRGRV